MGGKACGQPRLVARSPSAPPPSTKNQTKTRNHTQTTTARQSKSKSNRPKFPTFRADPLEPACDTWCHFPVKDRAFAVMQWLRAAAEDASMIKVRRCVVCFLFGGGVASLLGVFWGCRRRQSSPPKHPSATLLHPTTTTNPKTTKTPQTIGRVAVHGGERLCVDEAAAGARQRVGLLRARARLHVRLHQPHVARLVLLLLLLFCCCCFV